MSTRPRKSQFSAGTPRCEEATDEEQGGVSFDLIDACQIEDQLPLTLMQQVAEEPFQVLGLGADRHESGQVQDHNVRVHSRRFYLERHDRTCVHERTEYIRF